MVQRDDQGKPQPDAADRAELELEQTQLALEDAHAEIAALAEDNRAPRQSLERAERETIPRSQRN